MRKRERKQTARGIVRRHQGVKVEGTLGYGLLNPQDIYSNHVAYEKYIFEPFHPEDPKRYRVACYHYSQGRIFDLSSGALLYSEVQDYIDKLRGNFETLVLPHIQEEE